MERVVWSSILKLLSVSRNWPDRLSFCTSNSTSDQRDSRKLCINSSRVQSKDQPYHFKNLVSDSFLLQHAFLLVLNGSL